MRTNSLTYEEALHKSATYCSLSEHCISELRDKFEVWNVKESDREKIIQYLIQEKYIDETRFAIAYAKDKFRYNKWGKIKIRMQLAAKKINKEHIESALTAIEDKAYLEMIARLAKDKEKSITYKNAYEKKGKLYRYLTGKGFEMEVISKIINETQH